MASTGDTWRLRVAVLVGLPLAAVLALAAWRHGLGISYDSVVYASTRRLLETTGSWAFSSLWPPGFPAVLAVIGTGTGAVVLNCVALAVSLTLCYQLAVVVTGSRGVAAVVLGWLALSVATVSVHSMLWSEPLFYAAVNVALTAAVRIHQARSLTLSTAAALVVAVNVACLLRYAGVALVLFVAASLALSLGGGRLRRGLIQTSLVVAASAVGMVAVMGWNVAATGKAAGDRWPSPFTLGEVAGQIPDALSAFVLNAPAWPHSALIGLVLGVGLAWLLTRWARSLGWSRLVASPAAPLVLWVLIYGGFLIGSEATTFIDSLDYRLLLPVQQAAAILVAIALRAALGTGPRVRAGVGAYLAFVGATSLVWATTAAPTVSSLPGEAAQWRSASAAVSEKIPAGARIASNRPFVLVAATGRNRVIGFPDAGPGPVTAPAYVPYDATQYARAGDYVVWFGEGDSAPKNRAWAPLRVGRGFVIYRVRAES